MSGNKQNCWDKMNLISIDSSTIVRLDTVHRPAGQVYLPDLLQKAMQRYGFVRGPTLEDVLKPDGSRKFWVGKFEDVQITEFSIYGDGVIASSVSDTDILEAFVSDVFQWAEKEFGLIPALTSKPEIYFESSIIVQSDADLTQLIRPKSQVVSLVNDALKPDGYDAPQLVMSGLILDADSRKFTGRRKLIHFLIDRRVGIPFEENVFFSQAPMRTKDHLSLLRKLEALAD